MLEGYNFISLVAESDSAVAINFLSQIKQRSQPATCQIRLSLEHHSAPEFHCIGVPASNDEVYVIAKRTVNESQSNLLSDARHRIRVLFESLPVSLLVVTDDGTIEMVNPTAEKLFGYTGKEWRQLRLPDVVTRKSGVASVFEQLTTGRTHRLEGLKSTGDKIFIDVSAEYMDSAQHQLLLCIVDVSESMKLEALKQEFVEMISHDLRTPLTNLSLFLECIRMGIHKTWQEGKLEAGAENNYHEVYRLIRLVNKLLELDKLQEGFARPNFSEQSLKRLVQISIESLESIANERRIEFERDFVDRNILVDRDQLVQVLVNLLGNAVKFSPLGGTITVKVEDVANQTEVRVIDQGPGISPDMRDFVFERFAQLKTERSKDGSGLGLAICKTIVEAHGGTIGVDSEPGKGSSFWIRLPNNPAVSG